MRPRKSRLTQHELDFHPDPYYKTYSSTSEDDACHRGAGPAGYYGAETTDCDSPLTLINQTFTWIDAHLKNNIDFVIWTGDSARHDNDDQIPRSEQQIADMNKLLVDKFGEVFGKNGDPTKDFIVPIVPTLGNNDILPHNILAPGPNRWTERYTHIWHKFIPEEQRHAFERGGWYFVEVIPNTLAAFSLNTLYFFDSNTAVDGCADRNEPGYEQFEWLRIQLQFVRQRGMKAIITGHIPPAKTDSKTSWDETCWHKYAFWMEQYRDVVVGSLYGHMNIDHFMLQDFHDVDDDIMDGVSTGMAKIASADNFNIQGLASYLTELQSRWARLPSKPEPTVRDSKNKHKKGRKRKKSKTEKYLKKIGGEYAERFSVSLISPSVVPNYFPTLRVFEYNITGLDHAHVAAPASPKSSNRSNPEKPHRAYVSWLAAVFESIQNHCTQTTKYLGKHRRISHPKRPHKPSFTRPLPPSKSAPPGPAYSPQSLSFLSYTQYYANLTRINGDFTPPLPSSSSLSTDAPSTSNSDTDTGESMKDERWHEGKHHGRKPKGDKDGSGHHGHHGRKFQYEIEYCTKNDSVFNLTDLSVRSMVELAGRIGDYREKWSSQLDDDHEEDESLCRTDDIDDEAKYCQESDITATHKAHFAVNHIQPIRSRKGHNDKKKEKKWRKKRKRKAIQKLWYTFIDRAYVSSKTEEDIRDNF